VTVCARKGIASLEREVLVLHRHVVLQLLEREARPATRPEVGHLEPSGRPDALHVGHVSVVQPTDRLVLDEVVEAGKGIGALSHPDNGSGVLGRFALLGHRLHFPARLAVDRVVASQAVVELIDVALFEVLEAEVGAEEAL
jgi:hypothetical protein